MLELTEQEMDYVQVTEDIDENTIRVYKVVAVYIGDDNDPLTNISVDGYRDIDTKSL